jgi:hypothetical protein
MDREERGRFCQNCQKTVVDFTGMTDAEVLGYFSAATRGVGSRGAGPGGVGSQAVEGARSAGTELAESRICGRFLPEQLGRELLPASVQRNGWSGWRWVLASAMMVVRPPEGGKPVKAVAVEKAAGVVADSVRAWRPSIVKMDSLLGPRVPGTIPVVNKAVPGAGKELVGWLGAVSIGKAVRVKGLDSSILQKVVDTVVAWAPLRREDFVTLYPNPVARGEVLHLAWLSDVGKYQLSLLNMRGQLVAERVAEVGGAGQVDQWVLPVGLAAGVYVLRITERSEVLKDGSGRVDVREVVVR